MSSSLRRRAVLVLTGVFVLFLGGCGAGVVEDGTPNGAEVSADPGEDDAAPPANGADNDGGGEVDTSEDTADADTGAGAVGAGEQGEDSSGTVDTGETGGTSEDEPDEPSTCHSETTVGGPVAPSESDASDEPQPPPDDFEAPPRDGGSGECPRD